MTTEYDAVIFSDLPDPTIVWKNLGGYKVAHVLRTHGYSVLVIDHLHYFNQADIKKILNNCVSERTKFVGFSITFFNSVEGSDVRYPNAKMNYVSMNYNRSFCPQGAEFEHTLLDCVKTLNSKCKIVLGGASTISNLISNKNIDFIVNGYAEISIVNLMKYLEGTEPLLSAYKNIYGVTVVDDRNAEKYIMYNSTMRWLPSDIGVAKSLPTEISRGCVFDCAFCTYPMRGKKSTDHVRGIDGIVDEMEYNYQNYGITTYSLMDDTFNDDDTKLDMMLAARRKLSFDPIYWCYARLDLLTANPGRVDKMYDLGVRAMYMGIETLKKETGAKIGKGMHAEKQRETVEAIRKKYNNDILMHGSFIVGLPHEPADSIKSTLNLILSGDLPLHSYIFNPLIMRREADSEWWQSKIDKDYEKYGYTDQGQNGNDDLIMKKPAPLVNWKNDQMTSAEAVELSKYCNGLQQSDNLYLNGQTMWALMNYEEYSYERCKNLQYKDINWHELSKLKLKNLFLYKKQLFKTLNIG